MSLNENEQVLDSESPNHINDLSVQKSENLENIDLKESEKENKGPPKAQIIHRTIVIGKRVFEYTGPVNQEIVDLLDLIEANSLTDNEGAFRWFRRMIIKINDLNEKVENKLVCMRGLIRINLNDILLIFVWLVPIYMQACLRLRDFDDHFVGDKSSTFGSFITGGTVFLLSWILTAYTYIIIHIPKMRIIFLVFLIQVLVPAFILLYDFNLIATSSRAVVYNYTTIIYSGFFIGTFFYGFVLFLIKYSLKNRPNGKFISVFFMSLVHGILFIGILVPILLNFFNRSNVQAVATIIDILSAPVMIFIVISWIFIHVKFFYFPISTIERSLNFISEGIKKGIYKSQMLNKLHTSVWWKLMNRRVNIISSVIMGTIYIYCEINLWITMKDEFLRETHMNVPLVVISVVLFVINPFFLIFGISLVVSNYRNSNKFLIAPLFCGSLPMIGLVPLYTYIKTFSELSDLVKIIFFGFPIGIFFWITLILTGVRHKYIFYSSITMLCLFILLPFAYFFPLNEEKAFESFQPITTLIYTLGFMGAALFALLFLILIGRYFYKKFSKKELGNDKTYRFNLAVYFTANLKDCGFWFNAMFFMISFIALLYSIYNKPSNTSAIDSGTLNGVLVVLVFLFVLMNMIIRMRQSYISPSYSTSLSEKILQKEKNSEAFQRKELIRRRLITFSVIFFVILIPAICVPCVYLISDETISQTMKTVAAGVPLTMVIFGVLIYLKNRVGKYANFVAPSTVVLCWIFIYIPYCVIMPSVSAFLIAHSQNFAEFLQLSIALSAVLLMLGVTVFSVIVNMILKRLEFEKKLRFIAQKLKEALFKIAVRSDVLICRRLYEYFLLVNDEESYREQLLDGNPVNWLPVKDTDPDLHYSKQLITMEAYKILKKQGKIEVKEEKNMGCCEKLLRKCCCIKDKEEVNLNLDLLENALKMVTFNDQQMLITDDFLSQKFKRNNAELLNDDEERKHLNVYEYIQDKQDQKEKQEIEEIQNLNNVLQDPDFIKQGRMLRENHKSNKTPNLEQIAFSTNPIEIQKIKYSEHGSGIKNSLFLCQDWLVHVFEHFSHEDPSSPNPVLTYLDLFHMLRLGGIISKTRDYDVEYNDDSLITKENFDDLNDLVSFVPLNIGVLAMDLEGFSNFIVELGFACFPDETIEDSVTGVIHEFLYPNIMYLFPIIARNYKENVRTFLKPKENKGFDLELSLQNFKENNKIYIQKQKDIRIVDIENNKSNKLFDLRTRQKMLDNPIRIIGMPQNGDEELLENSIKNKRKSKVKSPMHSPKKSALYESPQNKKYQEAIEARRKTLGLQLEEKKKRFEEKKKMIDVMRKKMENDKITSAKGCNRVLLRLAAYCSRSCGKCKICFIKIKEFPSKLMIIIVKKLTELSKKLGFLDEEDMLETENEKLTKRKESPPWPEIISLTIATIIQAEKEYDSKMEKNLILHFNLSNIIALVGKFTDLYTFSNNAFKNIPWDTASNPVDIQAPDNSYSYLFWVSLGCSFFYAMLAVPATKQAKSGTLGMNSRTGQKAGFPHPQFLLTKGISILGSSLFLTIMKTYIDSFVCAYPNNQRWYMTKNTDITCLSDSHIMYMALSLVGIGLYYPMSTFFFPNFQFQDKALDVKYNPSFVVLLIQAKLIITGLSTLFQSFDGSFANFPLILQTGSTCIVLFLLSIASMKLKPCLIKKINLWDAGLYLIVSYMNGCACVVVLANSSTPGLIALPIGVIVIFIVTLLIHRKIYGPFNCFNFKNKVHNTDSEEEDENIEKKDDVISNDEDLENSKDSRNVTLTENERKLSRKKMAKIKKAMMANPNIIVKNPEDYKF